ncbi:hypothetical protein C2S51_029997 [Perilla frutescens var. frutescens]|nr:hypothetical protein C2S51_029997 [Perilla frutescens var. frutescens]
MPPSTRDADEFLIKEIVLTHAQDDRCELDSELLLSLVEATLSCSAEKAIVLDQEFNITDIDLSSSDQEPTSRVIYKISYEMLARCSDGENLHTNTMAILEKLGRYRWGAKMVLALASFTCSFGVFWLILQLQSENALAVSLAIVKRIPTTITLLKPKFKALNVLVRTMLKLARFVICYESMSLKHELVDDQDRAITKSKIYLATYWMCRSILVCSSQIADLRNSSIEQVHVLSAPLLVLFLVSVLFFLSFMSLVRYRTVVAAWGLYSLGNKLNSFYNDLGECIDKCQQQIETRLYEKMLHMFKEKEADNQKALRALFAWENEFPFKSSSSREKIGILELKSKTVLLLITKPDLLPVDKVFFLVQQTTSSESFVVLWVPILSLNEWSCADKSSFEFFSNRVPWLSVRRPWTLNSTVMNFIRQEWNFEAEPIIVVLNENGLVANTNAMDMVWIWGPKAFPFSTLRERELWNEANWTVDLMINGISPLLSEWVQQARNICIYGSENKGWIRKFNQKIKKIRTSGIELEVVYAGCKNPSKNVRNIIHTIDQEDLSNSMTFSTVNFFWFRLETLKRSIGYQNQSTNCDEIAARVRELLEMDSKEGWSVIGRGGSTDVLNLDQELLDQGLEAFHLWRGNAAETGLVRALRTALEAPVDGERCRHEHDEVVAYEEGLVEKTKICGSCKTPMEKFVLYKCDA